MIDGITRYYQCPQQYVRISVKEGASSTTGYFRFGEGSTCYGRLWGHPTAQTPDGPLHDALASAVVRDGTVHLDFDPSEVADNLHRELYVDDWRHGSVSAFAALYYFVRPILGVKVRKHLQKLHFRGWEEAPFPRWPVDSSVDSLHAELMRLCVRASGRDQIPFIWFWPRGTSSCAVMTHDVETKLGRDLCGELMDLNDSFGIKASFQVVPEERYDVPPEFLESIRRRGFEIAVHDLNHDGHLYKSREQFLERVARINAYGEQFRTKGFRAGVLYRKQAWYDALKFAYDMSVPNVARLDPQHGGCCTVMPYFVGDVLELPVTTIQDYTLFNILDDYSIDIWKQQMELITAKNGFMSFIVHPDYMVQPRQREVYAALLEHLVRVQGEKRVWVTTPSEVNRWWRQRAAMRLVEDGENWRIEGQGSERACIAYAGEVSGKLSVSLEEGARA